MASKSLAHATTRLYTRLLLALLIVLPSTGWGTDAGVGNSAKQQAMPEFPRLDALAWINSKPLTPEALRGKVVLLEAWTTSCINCIRSIPWLRGLEEEFGGQNFVVIGIHSPEFEFEKDRRRVARFVEQFELEHPIYLDHDRSYWNGLETDYWPEFYLVDREGNIRGKIAGEMRRGTNRARQFEAVLRKLLVEGLPENADQRLAGTHASYPPSRQLIKPPR